MKKKKQAIIAQYQKKGLILIPFQLTMEVSSAVLNLLVELFYKQYLNIEINENNLKNTNYNAINILIKEGFLIKEEHKNIYDIKNLITNKHIKQLKKTDKYSSYKYCEWCGIETFVLHKHHFPIPKARGGKDIINICPNCHCSFHYFVDSNEYQITQKTIDIFLDNIIL